jgi:hypothetical protein
MKSKDAAKGKEPMKTEVSLQNFTTYVAERAWTDAEKELDTIRQNSENTQRSRGYVKALEGLLLSYKNDDDKYIYLPKHLADKTEQNVEALRKESAEFSSNELHGEYDRGYFKALEDYLTMLSQTKNPQPAEQPQRPEGDTAQQVLNGHKE